MAVDVDGTLLGFDESLSPAVYEAVRDTAHELHLVIATGRSVHAALPVLERLGLDEGWVVCSNGAVILRLDPRLSTGWEVADAVAFDPGRALRTLVAHLPDALYAVEGVDLVKLVTGDFPDGELTGPARRAPFDELCSTRALRVIVRSLTHTPAEFEELVAKTGLHSVEYAVGWSAWLDIAPDGVSKASALEQVRRRLAVPAQETFAVGDGRNDIEMLRWAAHSAAMGNAVDDDVRAAADEVLPDIVDDGLAVFLRERVLLRDPAR